MKTCATLVCGLMACVALAGCTAPGETPQEKRANIQTMHDETLNMLYDQVPQARQQISDASCYAVFRDQGGGFLIGSGGGYGLAKSKNSTQPVYMQMGQFSGGLGLGFQVYRSVLIIDDPEVARTFMDGQWEGGLAADAVFHFADFGGHATAAGMFSPIRVYRLNNNGIVLRASLPVNMYMLYDKLNVPNGSAPRTSMAK